MLALKPWVRAVRDRDVIVFLDLRRDRYYSILASQAPAIEGVDGEGDGQAQTQVLKLGLAEIRPEAARLPPTRSILPMDTTRGASRRDLGGMWAACMRASYALKTKRLDRALQAIASRKSARPDRGGDSIEADVAIFEALRPWYPRRRVCLFDSLALMHFLVARGHAADLVMAVRTAPFSAHCWVGRDGVVLSDVLDNCRGFTPIACV